MAKENFELLNFTNLNLFDFNNIVRSWNVDFIQLRPSKFLADLSQIVCKEFQFGCARFNTAVKQDGFSPEGVWTFAFVNEVKIYWRNYVVEPNSVIIYAPGSEINAVSAANFEVVTFSISDDYLLEIIKEVGMEDFYDALKSIDVMVSKNHLWKKLRKAILNEIEHHIKKPNYKSGQIFKETITKELLALLKDSSVSTEKVSGKKRLKLLHDAEHYVTQHLTEPITISTIASYLNVSERTLLYAFKNRFDMGPKAFMLVLKLNHAHHRLHRERKINSIASLVRDSGFWHMGQFYKDYKKFFGELPSVTLKKSLLER
ncbi:MAG: helix-turn-helix domain-containing protein [Flavobacteriaceae bacterium]|nr:helix-turn-helix domain-containing protein [Flavobacteriaceae bacterium]